MTKARVNIEVDMPEGIELVGYHRHDVGHGFEVKWALPEHVACDTCSRRCRAQIEYKATAMIVRDLEVWGQPGFFVYQPPFHRCPKCGHRQFLLPPFKRKDVKFTHRFEDLVMATLIGSTVEDVARRLSISAEMVEAIVEHRLSDAKSIDPTRVMTDIGLDELSLKKRHKLYVTLLTDLTDPAHPKVLAVAKGKDEAAALQCLALLTDAQKEAIRTHRVDMGLAFNNAAEHALPNSRAVIDRFHVAKNFNELVDDWRKKNHARPQVNSDEGATEEVSFPNVGVSAPPDRS